MKKHVIRHLRHNSGRLFRLCRLDEEAAIVEREEDGAWERATDAEHIQVLVILYLQLHDHAQRTFSVLQDLRDDLINGNARPGKTR